MKLPEHIFSALVQMATNGEQSRNFVVVVPVGAFQSLIYPHFNTEYGIVRMVGSFNFQPGEFLLTTEEKYQRFIRPLEPAPYGEL